MVWNCWRIEQEYFIYHTQSFAKGLSFYIPSSSALRLPRSVSPSSFGISICVAVFIVVKSLAEEETERLLTLEAVDDDKEPSSGHSRTTLNS